jgi:hypothetical protein
VALSSSIPLRIIPQNYRYTGLELRKLRGDGCASPRGTYGPDLRASSRERGSWKQARGSLFRTGQIGKA